MPCLLCYNQEIFPIQSETIRYARNKNLLHAIHASYLRSYTSTKKKNPNHSQNIYSRLFVQTWPDSIRTMQQQQQHQQRNNSNKRWSVTITRIAAVQCHRRRAANAICRPNCPPRSNNARNRWHRFSRPSWRRSIAVRTVFAVRADRARNSSSTPFSRCISISNIITIIIMGLWCAVRRIRDVWWCWAEVAAVMLRSVTVRMAWFRRVRTNFKSRLESSLQY